MNNISFERRNLLFLTVERNIYYPWKHLFPAKYEFIIRSSKSLIDIISPNWHRFRIIIQKPRVPRLSRSPFSFFFFNFPWNLIPVNSCASQLFIVASFFLFFQDREKKMGKRLEKIPFVIDTFPLSFFILTISLGNFSPVLLHYFVRGYTYIWNVLTKRRRKARWNFSHDPWIAKPRSRFTTLGS